MSDDSDKIVLLDHWALNQELHPSDCQVSTMRPGVTANSTHMRILHLPTGTVVEGYGIRQWLLRETLTAELEEKLDEIRKRQ